MNWMIFKNNKCSKLKTEVVMIVEWIKIVEQKN